MIFLTYISIIYSLFTDSIIHDLENNDYGMKVSEEMHSESNLATSKILKIKDTASGYTIRLNTRKNNVRVFPNGKELVINVQKITENDKMDNSIKITPTHNEISGFDVTEISDNQNYETVVRITFKDTSKPATIKREDSFMMSGDYQSK